MKDTGLILIRNKKDIEEVSIIIKKILDISISEMLHEMLKKYDQYAFDVNTGNIICSIKDGKIHIAYDKFVSFYKIKSFSQGENFDNFKYYYYDDIKKDILMGMDKNGNLLVAGNILYDSLK